MLFHHFKLAIRMLWRNKFHSAINITGLAIGVSSCLVIYLLVSYELSFNKGVPDYENIYRVHSKFTGTFSGVNRGAPTAVASHVRDNFKGVESVAMFMCFGSKVQVPAGKDIKTFEKEKTVAIADEEYFKIFKIYNWKAGSPDALAKPGQTVLTESQAKKYFGEIPYEAMMGREVVYRDSLITHLAGIVAVPEANTDLEFTDFISTPTIEASWLAKRFRLNDWQSTNSSTQVFIKAEKGVTHEQLQSQRPMLSKIYNEKSTWAQNDFNVQPLSDIHFNAEIGIFDSSREPAYMPALITLIGVAILLLVIAAINFINLETAQALRRAREVGVRKVLGSTRTRLILQFVSESLVLTCIAVILALPLSEIGLSAFSEFIPAGVVLQVSKLLPFLLMIILFIGIIASAYPAFVLSSFLPAVVIKNQIPFNHSLSRTAFMRKALIVFQFVFAQVLIIGTLVVTAQIRFMLNKDLGFRKDAVIYFDTPWWEKSEKNSLLKNSLEAVPEIQELSLSESIPSEKGWSSSVVTFKNGSEEIKIDAFRKFGDIHYLSFYDMELLAGSNFQESDTIREFIINETMLKNLGFEHPKDAIGHYVKYGESGQFPIVGVVKDFHIKSLHDKMEPVIMANETKNFTCFNIRLNSANQSGDHLKSSLEKIEKAWKEIYPDAPFKYEFLDETIKNFYTSEQRTAKLAKTAMGLAIFISCLGLFGLASYTTVQRVKEISIRKVLGATARQIVYLLSRDFIFLVLLAFILAAPAAWYFVNLWLNEFPYKTNISSWIFIVTAVLAVVIAFVSVGYQTFKAANSNPSNNLRSE